MIVRTAWAQDGEPAAVVAWRYPALADDPFPSGAINAALAAIYNHPNEGLDNPYLLIVRDADHQHIGLVVTDPEEVVLAPEDVNALYALTMDGGRRIEGGGRVNLEGDAIAIPWRMPTGYQFPADPVNQALWALYNEGVLPYLYPVYDRADDDSELRQVGLLICGLLDLAGDASENWRAVRDRYSAVLDDDDLHPTEVPWGQKEWSLA